MNQTKKIQDLGIFYISRFSFLAIFFGIFFIFLHSSCSSHRKHRKNIAHKSKKHKQKPTARRQMPKVSLPRAEQKSGPTPNATTLAVIAEARTYMGTPHRMGGNSRSGIDCSGLMVISYKKAGILLPRSSREQSTIGTDIRLESISAGDLVFFSDKRLSNSINHVGLVTEVNGTENIRFIHTSNSLGVTENNLYSDYYYRNFVKAVRVK